MIHASSHLPPTIQAMISDSNIVLTSKCTGCDEEITVRRIIMPFGPNKGEEQELTYGCRCEDLQIARAVLRRRKELEQERLFNAFATHSLINPDLQNASFETYLPETESQRVGLQLMQDYVAAFDKEVSQNLLFTGTYGIGKSHLSVAAVKELMKTGATGVFISVPKLLTKLKATYNKNSEYAEDDLLSLLEKVDCLVLDDIGAEQGSESSGSWSISKIFEVVDGRLGKHTIYTTNLSGKDLQQKIGARNFSRIMQQTKAVIMSGPDHRLKHFMNN